MRISIALVVFLFTPVFILAQETDPSLTDEFSGLGAKERTRIAKREAKESANDLVFQEIMRDADSLFRSGLYNESIDKYKEARVKRPYNVHPKVKIQDLLILIEQEEQMNGELASDIEQIPVMSNDLNAPPPTISTEKSDDEHVDTDPAPLVVKTELNPQPKDEPIPTPQVIPTNISEIKESARIISESQSETATLNKTGYIEKPDPAVSPISKEAKPISAAIIEDPIVEAFPIPEDGVTKDVYREANAVITELTVVRNGRTDVYKKVYHQWGYVFYFKNGSAITERMWADETLTFY